MTQTTVFATALILAVAGLATRYELKESRIPNWVTYGSALLGLAGLAAGPGWKFMLLAAAGALFSILIFQPIFRLGAMGGGDIKLIAAFGAIGGLPFLLETTTYGFIAGAGHALLALAAHQRLTVGIRSIGRSLMLLMTPHAGSAAWASASGVRIKLGIDLSIGAAFALLDRQLHLTGFFEPFQLLVEGWIR